MSQSGRGGARPNAGRKPNPQKLKSRTYRTSDEEHEIIKRWLKRKHKRTD